MRNLDEMTIGKTHPTLSDSETESHQDVKIVERLVQNSNIGIGEIQSLMEIIYHPGSIRRLCFYLFSKTEDSNERSKISEWIRNQPRTVEIDGEPSTNQKSFSITFNGDKDLKGNFTIFGLHDHHDRDRTLECIFRAFLYFGESDG